MSNAWKTKAVATGLMFRAVTVAIVHILVPSPWSSWAVVVIITVSNFEAHAGTADG